MICSRCKLDKDVCLFTPGRLKSSSPYCRKCQSEYEGTHFGEKWRETENQKRWTSGIKAQLKKDLSLRDAKNAHRNQEMQRLIEARKARLNPGA